MAISSVPDWLDAGKPYAEGVELFKKYSDDLALIDLFEMDDDDYNRDRLCEELLKLNAGALQMVRRLENYKWNTNNFSEQAKELSMEAAELTRLINNQRGQLDLLQTSAERFPVVKSIVHSARRRKQILKALDYYDENGNFPDEAVWLQLPDDSTKPESKPTRNPTSPVDKYMQYKNLAPRISKAKKAGDLIKYNQLVEERDRLKSELGI